MSATPLEIVAKQAQDYYKLSPVIILGTGASAAFGMSGMWDLAQYLVKTVDVASEDVATRKGWEECCVLLKNGMDLESALQQAPLGSAVTAKVVRATWDLLNPQDLNVFYSSMTNSVLFPLGKLLRHYLTSTQSQIHIITSNYDRLAEYACEQEGIHHYTEFSYGFPRRHAVPRDYQPQNDK